MARWIAVRGGRCVEGAAGSPRHARLFAAWLAADPGAEAQDRLLRFVLGDEPGAAARLEGFLEHELAEVAVAGVRSVG
jgi:hypothetical protein